MSPLLWSFVLLAIELPFIIFSVSIALCILREIRKSNAVFVNEFFAMYLMQSAADIVTIVAVRSGEVGGQLGCLGVFCSTLHSPAH